MSGVQRQRDALEEYLRLIIGRVAVPANCTAVTVEIRGIHVTFEIWRSETPDAEMAAEFDNDLLVEVDLVMDAPDPDVGPDYPDFSIVHRLGWPAGMSRSDVLFIAADHLLPAIAEIPDADRLSRVARRCVLKLWLPVGNWRARRAQYFEGIWRARRALYVAVCRALLGSIPKTMKVSLAFTVSGLALVVWNAAQVEGLEAWRHRTEAALSAALPGERIAVSLEPLDEAATLGIYPIQAFLPGSWDHDGTDD